MEKRTPEQVIQSMSLRREAWLAATELVVPVLEEHGLEPYETHAVLFVKGSTMTKVDQNVSHIQGVADWLLEPIQGE